jgi:hypothetical protein
MAGAPDNCKPNTYVEIIGMAESANTIKELKSTSFGDNFDLTTYNSVIDLSNGRMKDIFMAA